jgi:hypothetical protein
MLDHIYIHDRYDWIQQDPRIDHDFLMAQLYYIMDRLVPEHFYNKMMDIDVHHIKYDLC